MTTQDKTFYWTPSEEFLANSNMKKFLEYVNVPDYDALIQKANEDPAWYFESAMQFGGVQFNEPYRQFMDNTKGHPWTEWCVGGKTSIVLNCIDKHKNTPTYNQPALVWEKETGENGTLTYREYDAEISKLAAGLKSLGVGKGDVVGIFMPSIAETYIAFFAILKIGAIVMPLFSGFGPQPLTTRINDGGAKAVITADGTWRRGDPLPLKPLLDEIKDDVPSLEKVIVARNLGDRVDTAMTAGRDYWWDELVADKPSDFPTEVLDAQETSILLYTSGTTGKPKGTVWTQVGFITRMITDIAICSDFKPGDRFFFMSDMGWMVGAMCAIIPSLLSGSLLVVEGAPDYPQRDRFWRVIDQYEVSFPGVSPTLVRGMMRYGEEDVSKYAFDNLRVTISGGEAWTETPWLWYFKNVCREKHPIVNITGGTEMGGNILIQPVTKPIKPSAFYGPCPGVGADVVNDAGESMPAGEVGELVLRHASISMTKSLWQDDERYLDTYWNIIPDMWVHGDWAMRDEDGYWYLLGRSDDTIKISGKRTGPSELEGVIMETGQVAEVAVVGIPDELKGSVLYCVCVPLPGVDADDKLVQTISNALIDGMGKSYRPKQVIFVSDLPRTRNMKVMRRVVRAVLTNTSAGDLSALVNPETVEELKAALLG
ncbi:MAG: AMP-binding protein [Gammaproteobacteria bacterium]|nr:AMP-binding protein [Gammaproteobacteria bacterium]